MYTPLLIVLAALLAPVASWACSCGYAPPQRQVMPADGARAVPTDATLRVFLTDGFPEGLRRQLATEYRLVGPEGTVTLSANLVRTRLDLRPTALRPNTDYRLEALSAYDAQGQRLDDAARLRAARGRGPKPTQRIWYAVSQFHTAAMNPARERAAPALETLDVHVAFGGGDCGPGTALSAGWNAHTVGPLDVVELEVDGFGVVSTTPVGPVNRGKRSIYVSDLMCNADPFSVGTQPLFRARIVLRNARGDALSSPWLTASPKRPPSGLSPQPKRPQPPAAAMDAWFEAPIVPTPAPVGAGPTGCAHGLELGPDRALAEAGAQGDFGSHSMAVQVAGGLAGLTVRDGAAWLVGGEAPVKIGAASAAIGVPATGGPVVLLTDHQAKHVHLQVVQLDAAGQPIWQTTVANTHTNWHAEVAACGDRVVVAWGQVVGDKFEQERLQWALLNKADGAIIRQVVGKAGMRISGETLGLGCLGEGALIVVPARGALASLGVRINREGKARTVKGLPAGQHFSVVTHDQGAMLAFAHNGGVFAQPLDAKGGLVGSALPLGEGRKPVLAPLGPHWAVAWEAPAMKHIRLTAMSMHPARVAEPVSIKGAARWHTPALLSAGDEVQVVAGFAQSLRGLTATCRSQPTGRAPAQLAP